MIEQKAKASHIPSKIKSLYDESTQKPCLEFTTYLESGQEVN